MSRQVDVTKPLSDEDRAYLQNRNDLSTIALNEQLVGAGVEEEAEEPKPRRKRKADTESE